MARPRRCVITLLVTQGLNHIWLTLPNAKVCFVLTVYLESLLSNRIMVDLSRPCDACGGMVGGAAKYCLKCQIYFCFVCSWQLMNSQSKFPVECPLCGEKLVYYE